MQSQPRTEARPPRTEARSGGEARLAARFWREGSCCFEAKGLRMEGLDGWGESCQAGAQRPQGLRTEGLGGKLNGKGQGRRGAAAAPTKGLLRAPTHLSPQPEARPTRPERPQALRTQAPAWQLNPSRPDPNARKP